MSTKHGRCTPSISDIDGVAEGGHAAWEETKVKFCPQGRCSAWFGGSCHILLANFPKHLTGMLAIYEVMMIASLNRVNGGPGILGRLCI